MEHYKPNSKTREQIQRYYARSLHKAIDETDIVILFLDTQWPAEVDWWKTRFKLEMRQERKKLAVLPAKPCDITSLTNESQIRRHSLGLLNNAIDGSDIVILVMDIRDPEGCRSLEEVMRRRAGEQLKLAFVQLRGHRSTDAFINCRNPQARLGSSRWFSKPLELVPLLGATEASSFSHIPIQELAMPDDAAAQAPAVMVGNGRRSLEEP
ncbi:hypothetical protein BU15DRAFT_66205 [Melanogaster broomeanus]|nr:hypothetical protein BU15DRAFT_66205 [Melanogaster broomeanus]